MTTTHHLGPLALGNDNIRPNTLIWTANTDTPPTTAVTLQDLHRDPRPVEAGHLCITTNGTIYRCTNASNQTALVWQANTPTAAPNITLVAITTDQHKLPRYHFTAPADDNDTVTWTFTNPADDSTIATLSGTATTATSETFTDGGTYRAPVMTGWAGTTAVTVTTPSGTATLTIPNLGTHDLHGRIKGYAADMDLGELFPLILDTATEAALTTAVDTDERYITIHPTIANSTIPLTEILYSNATRGVFDGRERNLTISTYDTKYNGPAAYIMSHISFYNSTIDPAESGLLAFRNFTTTSYIAVNHCSFDGATDECCSFGWNQGNDVYATVQNCYFTNADKASLLDFGTGEPQEGGNYYATYLNCYFMRIKQRQPMIRNGHAQVINCVHEAFGDAAGSGTAINPTDTGEIFAIGCICKPGTIGQPAYDGTAFTNPRTRVTSNAPDGPLAYIGGIGLDSDDAADTGEWTENTPSLTTRIPATQHIYPQSADTALYETIKTNAGNIQ